MGNFCDSHLDPKLEADLPIKDLFGDALDEKVVSRALSIHSCLNGQKQLGMEVAFTDEDYRALPECLLPFGDDESGEEDELDFSKDRDLYDKRVPAVYVGRDADTGEAKYRMPSPPRASSASLRNVETGCRSGPVTVPLPPAGSFWVKPGTVATSAKKKPEAQLQRSSSSYVVAPNSMRMLPRSDSSYIYTKTLQRSDSSYVYTNQVSRSQSAPSGALAARSPQVLCGGVPSGSLVEDLQLLDSSSMLDPSLEPFRQRVCAALGVREPARIDSMQVGFAGGQNQGMWVLQDVEQIFVLKLVEGKRKHRAVPTEAEQFSKIAMQHPTVRTDPSLAFPIKVFQCHDSNGHRHHDLIVMRKAPGRCLAQTIAQKWDKHEVSQLMQLFESLGRFLAGIHNRYRMQHGDFQPSNIFYDETTGHFTLVDVGGMDSTQCLMDSDVEHFDEALRILGRAMQAKEVATDASRHFRSGYTAAARAT